MPYRIINGARIHYTDTGGDGDVVLFAHGLGWSGRMFSSQVAELSGSYRCITVDFRGQGASEVTLDGYGMDQLADDLIDLLNLLNLQRVHFIGLSMGGFVGMRLAARSQERIKSLILLNTSPFAESTAKRLKYQLLSLAIRWFGVRALTFVAMRIMFGTTLLRDASRILDRDRWRDELLANDRIGIVRAIRGVVHRTEVHSALARIASPTLVVVGEEDTATPPACGQAICNAVRGATIRSIPQCGHSSTIESPNEINRIVREFLERIDKQPSIDTPYQS